MLLLMLAFNIVSFILIKALTQYGNRTRVHV